jgi:hypothetical protein
MRNKVADFLISLGFWLEGSGWHYDEFNAGYVAGRSFPCDCTIKRARAAHKALKEPEA